MKADFFPNLSLQTDMECWCEGEDEGDGECNCRVRGGSNLWSNIIRRQFGVFEEKALFLIQGRPLVRKKIKYLIAHEQIANKNICFKSVSLTNFIF